MASSTPTGPGLYTEIGKKSRDLLYKGYHTDSKLTFTAVAPSGAEFLLSNLFKKEAILIQNQLMKHQNATVDLKVTSEPNLITTVTVPELSYIPGLKGILSIPILHDKSVSGKAELQYLYAHANINASVGLNANPLVNLSGVIGTIALAFGADVAFDTASGDFTKYNAGVSFTNEGLTASLILNNKGDTLAASYYQQVKGATAVGAELAHSFSSNANTLTIGTQHALDPLTTVKGRFNNNGIASALIQHAWRPKSVITVSTEFDTKAMEKRPKFGLAYDLRFRVRCPFEGC